MPGSVANAAPSTVMPQALCREFVVVDEWTVDQNTYRSGEVEVRSRVTNKRRRWRASMLLTAAQLATWKAFFLATLHAAFYYYDPYEASGAIGSNYDGTGSSTTGRFTVCWQGSWKQQMNLGRFSVELELCELA
jgi:hypothetical protein